MDFEKGIDINSRGGEWILLVLEEAKYARDLCKKFSVRSYLLSLKMTEPEIKAAYAAISMALLKADYRLGIKKFISECLD